MSSEPHVKVRNLSEIRSEVYSIPLFQRDYVWSKKDLDPFLQDLWDGFSEDDILRLGSILTYTDSSVSSHRHIVDGQQRLTTLFLLDLVIYRFVVTKDLPRQEAYEAHLWIGDAFDEDKPLRLQFQHRETRDWMTWVVNNPQTPVRELKAEAERVLGIHGQKDNGFSQTEPGRILAAIKLLEKDLVSNIDDQDSEHLDRDLFRFSQFLKKSLRFVCIDLDNAFDALSDFEKLNSRGQRLSPLDLIKSLLMQGETKEKEVSIQNRWEKVQAAIGDSRSGGKIFRRIVIAGLPQSAFHDVSVGNIYNWVTTDPQIGFIQANKFRFLDEIIDCCRFHRRLMKSEGFSSRAEAALERISKLEISEISYLALITARLLPPELIDYYMEGVETIVTIDYLCGIQPKTTEKELIRLAKCAVHDDDIGSPQSNRINNALAEFRNKRRTSFELALRGLSYEDDTRAKYVLARISGAWRLEAGLPNTNFSTFFSPKYSLDHIHARKSVSGDIDSGLKESLGNLTLLVPGGNSAKKNGPLQQHLDVFQASECPLTQAVVGAFKGYGQDGAAARAARRMPQDYSVEWTEADIKERHNHLVDMALDVFGF